MRECWTSEDLEELVSRLSRLKNRDSPFFAQCNAWVGQTEDQRRAANEARDRGEYVPDMSESMAFGKSNYGHSFDMDKALATLSEEDMFPRVICTLCSDIILINPTKTDVCLFLCQYSLNKLNYTDY